MFWLKKVVSFWLMPLPLCLGLLVIGLLRGAKGRRLLLAAAALLLVFSNRFVSTRLLRPLEARFPAVPEVAPGAPVPGAVAACSFVAVLGSGHSVMDGVSATGELSSSGLARIVEAVRIARLLPEARLILSGPAEHGNPSHASVLATAAESLGVEPARIILLESARDTQEEAFAVARRVGSARTALVTSAWHMPRAAHLFQKAGVAFVPCPSDFNSRGDIHLRWNSFGFDAESLERSTLAIHEELGLLWNTLRGA